MRLKIVAILKNPVILINMTKREKLIDRLLIKPTDFTWSELTKALGCFGYKQISAGKTGGSRVRFIHPEFPPIILHKPHPKPVLKHYQLEQIIEQLKQEKLV